MLVYRPTFTKKIKNSTARYIADGFLFSTNLTFATGQPLSATVSSFTPTGGIDGGVTGGEVSNSGGITGGRPPQFMRNQYYLPGMKQVDLRVSRDLPITEKVRMQFLGEAFNLFNHTNVFAQNAGAYSYQKIGTTATSACPSSIATGTAGCLSPVSTFQQTTATSSTNGLYTARQLQVSAKIIF
jgi:hypothetical protein